MARSLGNVIVKKILESRSRAPEVSFAAQTGRVTLEFRKDGSTAYLLDGRRIRAFHSYAVTAQGKRIDTRSARRSEPEVSETRRGWAVSAEYADGDLVLTQNFWIRRDEPFFAVSVCLSAKKGNVETNRLAPLDFPYPSGDGDPLFLSLDQKMLLVPYDNDMWVRYESAPLRPGRTSYDVTCIYDEKTLRGLLIGALDHEVWKNAVSCSATDARSYTAFSGAADAGTHDCVPHGTLKGAKVHSSRFLCGWAEDVRDALEAYGARAVEGDPSLSWSSGVPFGWNSYSALAADTTVDHWKQAADFLHGELPEFRDEDGCTFVNLDAVYGISRKRKREIVEELHARGQKAGTYLAPLIWSPLLDLVPLKGSVGKLRRNTVMKLPDGSPYPAADGSVPVDVTRPEVEKDLRLSLREIVEDGFDYLKIDFTSHGAVEGERYDRTVRTGRQALSRFYAILREELDPEKTGREIFVSLSISPLFPAGGGHARRCCCDAFGHPEDVRYVLNALNFGWWAQPSLYRFCDPDHTVLYHSVVDGRGSTDLPSARSRYLASVISGTVMLLSDNYGPSGDGEIIRGSRERALTLANDPEINRIARIGKPFRPLSLKDGTCPVYFLEHEGRRYAAVFNFSAETKEFRIRPEDLGAPLCGTAEILGRYEALHYENELVVRLEGHDSALLELKG